jgi:hypothetical protein
VIERLIENWLNDVNERGYEGAFCQALVAQGQRIVHRSSHGLMEQGKDVISIDRGGVVHAYQLKTGKLDQGSWRQIRDEIVDLVELPINHPNIPVSSPFVPHLVSNGSITDAVRNDIVMRNQGWRNRGFPPLNLLLKDDLFRIFVDLHGRFLPATPKDFDTFLRLFLGNKSSPLNKTEFAGFLRSVVPGSEPLKRQEIARLFAATAVLANYVLSGFQARGNHLAVAEGWILVIAHLLRVAESARAYEGSWAPAIQICMDSWEAAVESLVGEAIASPNWMEGDILVDPTFVGYRRVILSGYLSAYALYKRMKNGRSPNEDEIFSAVHSRLRGFQIWSEETIPYLFSAILFLWVRGREGDAVQIAESIVRLITKVNAGRAAIGLPDPYYDLSMLLAQSFFDKQVISPDQTFAGTSLMLRPVVEFLVRRERRSLLKSLWYDITGVDYSQFNPAQKRGLYEWRTERGTLATRRWRRPETWVALTRMANEKPTRNTLLTTKYFPLLLPFLLVYPHRMTAALARLVETSVAEGL